MRPSFSKAAALTILAVLLASPLFSLYAAADVYTEQVSGETIKIGITISLTGKYRQKVYRPSAA
ncbi:hypothetical protein [Aeropyrum camini]|uniref:Uncharacterized protein n=1 Tax=Aeropyrum camini SY1 = JCM 12091 TaxID=1198449 RepID=U3TI92_9CREN|nr:hypothetical protein [Aeropyrum camini]BAN91074.1 hypothetical protein ACAM_1605 [Aeropyrum camini SY1 = JCM 12091]